MLPAVAADPPPAPVPPVEAVPAPRPVSVARPMNTDRIRQRLGLTPGYATVRAVGAVKVAVLDNGFAGAGPDRPYLPKTVVVVEHYDPDFVRKFGLGDPNYRKPFVPGEAHGRLLAQLVWATAGGSPDGPQFYLLNANGPTLFRRAVRYAIEAKVDVILFAGTFEGAGNYDGRGPLAPAVDEAVAAGIIWVNAAGNTGGMVYNGPADFTQGGNVRFGGADGLTALRFRNRLDENTVTITLTWNDYKDVEDAGTDKDLDLYVEDVSGRPIGQSTLKQVPTDRPAGEGETKNPRERVVLTDLGATQPGQEYRIRVKAKAGTYGPKDRIRVLLASAKPGPIPDPATGKPVPVVDFLDASNSGEVYPPADHPGVITVGDTSRVSAVGPTADGRVKPDVILESSSARYTNGEETDGSSNAAAYFAGIVAAMRATEPGLTTAHVREWVRLLDGKLATGIPPAATTPQPPTVPGALPPTPGVQIQVALTPNQERALRFAVRAAEDQRARGLPSPGVYVSGTFGSVVVRPGGVMDPPPVSTAAVYPRGGVVEAVRRAPPPHVPWWTPTPSALATLVRGVP